ncbi:MAG TPA: MmcQ/YjbR family DNA-binding protein [Casimicrobiaceae bacterium]|nr:MmcQ/YjbR family DNA-binding protein [Casimicrobiaceae bacterium]
MSFQPLRRHCASLPGATMDVKWGADECWSVGGKMFAVFGLDGRAERSLSFKCDPERFLELTDQPGILPAPYLARAHWVQVVDAAALPASRLRALVDRSHALVAARLTRRARDAAFAAPSPPR